MKSFPKVIICFIVGALSAFSMAPYNLFPILFITLSALYAILAIDTKEREQSKLRYGLLYGFAFSFGYFVFGLSWVGNALLVEGNPYKWAWPLAICGLPLILAPFMTLACGLSARFLNFSRISGFIGFVILLSTFEWFRGFAFTGFPWNLFGYTWTEVSPIKQNVYWGNTYILTGLTILWATLPAFILFGKNNLKQKIILTGVIVSSFAGCFVYGLNRISNYKPSYHENIEIRLPAPYIPQEDKWAREKIAENFYKYIQAGYAPDTPKNQNTASKTTYIVWPETALSQGLIKDRGVQNEIRAMLLSYEGQTYLMSGYLRREEDNPENFYNSFFLANQDVRILSTYDKHHLVPFGEYMPFQDIIPIKPVVEFSGFTFGDGLHKLQTPEGLSFSPLICYEAIFPGKSYNKKSSKPDMLVNVTNDAWYYQTRGPEQHFVIASFRAIETGIPMIRAANGGISAVINPLGNTEKINIKTQGFPLPHRIR